MHRLPAEKSFKDPPLKRAGLIELVRLRPGVRSTMGGQRRQPCAVRGRVTDPLRRSFFEFQKIFRTLARQPSCSLRHGDRVLQPAPRGTQVYRLPCMT
jgi:hypothetical protein